MKSSSKETLRNFSQRVRIPLREDDIRTVMDTIPPADSDVVSKNLLSLETRIKREFIAFQGSSVGTASMNRYLRTNSAIPKSEPVPRQFSTKQQLIPSSRITSKESRRLKGNKKDIDEHELKKKVTMITDEHLSSLVPVIADLMSVVTSKVKFFWDSNENVA